MTNILNDVPDQETEQYKSRGHGFGILYGFYQAVTHSKGVRDTDTFPILVGKRFHSPRHQFHLNSSH